MKMKTITQKSGSGFSSGLVQWLVLLFVLLAGTVSAQTRSYPFPQNYQYPFGQIYKGPDVQTKIQGLYNTWKTNYYVEGTMNGVACARIKFQQPGQNGDLTVSEGIAYGMLITVYMDNSVNNTQTMFDKLWAYYKLNMDGNGVMNYKINAFKGPTTGGTNGATDAEIDAATALLLAYKQWGKASYLTDAQTLINNIYTSEVNPPYLKPGDMFNRYANPSYVIGNGLHLFGKVEVAQGWKTTDRWAPVVAACNRQLAAAADPTTGLLPTWCTTPGGDNNTLPDGGGHITGIIESLFDSYLLYDAVRCPWRIAHNYAWYGDPASKALASKITTWAKTKYNDPGQIVDGYFLDGTPFNNPLGNPMYTGMGNNHNACWSSGLSIGSMVDPTLFADYLPKCWSVGTTPDGQAAYYTQTTQLLYMLCLSGNMPNFWDMKPVPTAAQTDGNGRNILIDFSKAIATTAVTTGWTVNTYADQTFTNPIVVPVSAVSVNGTRVTVTLAADIAQPYIKITYAGTSIIASSDKIAADPFTDMVVANKITNMEPYPITIFTDLYGTTVKVQWSKAIKPTSLDKTAFTLMVKGVATTISTMTMDPTDTTITNLNIVGGTITKSTDVVTLSFAGGSITGTSSAKTAKAFTNAPVQNFYMSVTCFDINDFKVNKNLGILGDNAGDWSSIAVDPLSTVTVGHWLGNNKTKYQAAHGLFGAAILPSFQNAINQTNAHLKFRMYVKAGTFAATGENIQFIFSRSSFTTKVGVYYDPNNAEVNVVPSTVTNAWVEYDVPIPPLKSADNDYLQIRTSVAGKGIATTADFYLDSIRICPPTPVVSFVSGHTTYDGTQIEVRFSTAMKLPSNGLITVSNALTFDSYTVSSITAKQGDATVLVLTLATPVTAASALTVSYDGTPGFKAVDGRACDMFSGAVANLVGISTTTGWRDDFGSLTDFVTLNLGADTTGYSKHAENATAPGTYDVTINGKVNQASLSITTYVNQLNATKQVMDLTGRELIQFRYRVPSATSKTLFLKVGCKDKINDYTTDDMSLVPLRISPNWIDTTINISNTFYKKYGAPTGDGSYNPVLTVDRTNIYQVMLQFLDTAGKLSTKYVPKQFDGNIQFDYISVGSAIVLTNVTASVNEGLPISATSNVTGQIFIVPVNTPPMLKSLQDSVFAGRGVVVTNTAAVASDIPTKGLTAGFYWVFAYNPITGAISASVNLPINDVTPPTITKFDSGNIGLNKTVTATVSKNAKLYLVPSTLSVATYPDILNNSIYNVSVSKDIPAAIPLSNIVGLKAGDKFVFVAADYASPVPNISAATAIPVTVTPPSLTMNVTPTDTISQGTPVAVTVNRTATTSAYLVPDNILITSVADLTANAVKTLAIAGISANMVTTDVPKGSYYMYVSDGTDIAGPSTRIVVKVTTTAVKVLTLLPTSLSVEKGVTKTATVSFDPVGATNKSLTLKFDNAYVSATYNATTNVLSVTGIASTTTASTITLTSPDGPSVAFSVDVTCPTLAPTKAQVPNVTTCPTAPAPLVATFTSPTAKAVWYSTATTGTALATVNSFNHGKTTGISTYYVAQSDNGCESATRLAVILTINDKPAKPVITNVSVCEGATPYQISATGTNITWFDSKKVQISTDATLKPTITTTGVNTYYATQVAGVCVSDTAVGTLTINALPTVTLTGDPAICSNAAAITLIGTPQGGIFSGAGVNPTTGSFNPALVALGSNKITYSYADVNKCVNEKPLTITVNSASIPTVTGNTCQLNATTIPALSASGSGSIEWYVSATATATVATGNSYSPTVSTATKQDFTYYAVNLAANGCRSERVPVILSITDCATPLPTVTGASICKGDATGTLQAVGTGIIWYDAKNVKVGVDNTFKPKDVDAGTYTYYASQTLTCEGAKAPATFVIKALPAISFPAVSPLCFNDAPYTLSATPANGTFSGTGVSNGSLTPSQANAGDIKVIYTYSDATSKCVAKDSQTVKVTYVAPPVVTPSQNIVQLNVLPTIYTATGTAVNWYSDVTLLKNVGSGPTYQAPAQSVKGKSTFYATQTVTGCTSNAAEVTLDVSSCLTALPTITNAESCVGDAIRAITATGTSLQWYSDAALTAPITVATPNAFVPTIDKAQADIKTFYVTQNTGCEGSAASVTYTVKALPTVTLDPIPTICSDVITVTPLNGNPVGGVFIGDVTTSTFIPKNLTIGLHPITYKVTALNGCSNIATQTITIKDCAAPKVTSISITPTLTVAENASGKINVLSLLPAGASTAVEWVTGSKDSATVATDGMVTGVKAGKTYIVAKATDGSNIVSNRCVVTITKVATLVSSITIPSTLSIELGKTGSITTSSISVLPSVADNKTVTWSVVGTGGSVNATSGLITLTGTVGQSFTVIATATDAGKVVSNNCVVTIIDPVLSALSFTTSTANCLPNGTVDLSKLLVFTPLNAANVNINWTSEISTSGSINLATGVFTATPNLGTAIVTATDTKTKLTAKITVTIADKTYPVESITVIPADTTLYFNQHKSNNQFYVKSVLNPLNATNKGITWTATSDVTGVSVDKLGFVTITGITANANATITATTTDGGKKAYATIKMLFKTKVDSVGITTQSVPVNQNGNLQLEAFSYPLSTNKTVSWSIDPTSTSKGASISTSGMVTAGTTDGTIKVIAKVTDDDATVYTDNITITVKTVVLLSSIVINDGATTLPINKGDSKTLVVTYDPINTDQTGVTFVSSDPSVVSITSKGEIVGKKGGKATITVIPSANASFKKTIEVTVDEKVSSIVLSNANKDIPVGDSATIIATINEPSASNNAILVTVDDTTIAKITKISNTEYSIKGKAVGSTNIIATATDGSNVTTKILVNFTKVSVSSVSILNQVGTIEVGKTISLGSSVIPKNATINGVKWYSTNPTILTVSSNGVVKGISTGKASIILTPIDDSTKSKTIEISVTDRVLFVDSLYATYDIGVATYSKYRNSTTIDKAIFANLISKVTAAQVAIVDVTQKDTAMTQDKIDQANLDLQHAINQVKCNCILVRPIVDVQQVETSEVIVYPNPVLDILNIKGEGVTSVQVIGLYGKVVLTTSNTEIDLSDLAKGVYTIVIKSKVGVTFQTIVKE